MGFKPTERTSRSPDFESGPFGHSGIFPLSAANILTFLIRYHRQQQIFYDDSSLSIIFAPFLKYRTMHA
ncbi:hypothetical protein BACCOP_00502 [Phocaeicola coprocola DSM 17136]|uniref:Uncharacterized protein n=1 Tax=Phocaeicola coprocola DSM 17136 TaxID=470145 RepID=B3JF57_9BACT|nr:hypothetical protein BACCOP_00502 [Phocaeicola coprocola DSM 17136]